MPITSTIRLRFPLQLAALGLFDQLVDYILDEAQTASLEYNMPISTCKTCMPRESINQAENEGNNSKHKRNS